MASKRIHYLNHGTAQTRCKIWVTSLWPGGVPPKERIIVNLKKQSQILLVTEDRKKATCLRCRLP